MTQPQEQASSSPAALSAERHRNLKLQRSASLRHAVGYHAVTLVAAEIPKAGRSYPVLFARQDDKVQPVALLSLVEGENQFLEGDTWLAEYVPAAIRAYPFRLAGEQVLIDESAAMLSETEGDALFAEDGQPAACLTGAIDFLREFYVADAATRAWCERISTLGLLGERQAEIVSPQGVRYRVDGFWAVDEAKLATLSDDVLAALVKDGSLALIYAHLLSLEGLVALAARRDAIATTPAAPPADEAAEAPKGKRAMKDKAPSA